VEELFVVTILWGLKVDTCAVNPLGQMLAEQNNAQLYCECNIRATMNFHLVLIIWKLYICLLTYSMEQSPS